MFVRGWYWDWWCLTSLSATWRLALSVPSGSLPTTQNSVAQSAGEKGCHPEGPCQPVGLCEPHEVQQRQVQDFAEQGGMASNWKLVGLDIRKNSLGGWSTATDCPETLWTSHPCNCLRSGWMGLWAVCFSRRRPCPCQGVWNSVIFKVSSIPMLLYNSTFKLLLEKCKNMQKA